MSALRVSLVVLSIACAGGAGGEEGKRWAAPAPATADWPVTEGAPGGGRYTPLADITRANGKQLRVAWTHRHGDFFAGDFPLCARTGAARSSRRRSSGRVVEITHTRVPRLIGKGVSMIGMLKKELNCSIFVGQNGRIWRISGEASTKL